MGLIAKILSRKQKGKAKPSIAYLKSLHKTLKQTVERIRKIAQDLQQSERLCGDFPDQSRLSKLKTKATAKEKELVAELRKLDKAVEMYFHIDEFKQGYSDLEKRYLGELQKFWHSINLDDLPAEQWSIIAKLVLENNLQNARYLTG